MLWRASKTDDLVWAAYEDDEHVVFHRPSGKTHFVNAVTATLLKVVLSSPTSASAAVQQLADAQGVAVEGEFAAAVNKSLHHLEYLGLVERCDT